MSADTLATAAPALPTTQYALFTKAASWGLAHTNPVVGTEAFPEDNEAPRPLTPDEEERRFQVLPDHYQPIVLLTLNTGLRLNELRTQLWKDVDLAAGVLTLTVPKSKKYDVLPWNAAAVSLLAGLWEDTERIFPDMPKKMSDLFARYAKKAGLDDVTFHDLRDIYISPPARHCNTPTLMALARHRDYKTTQRYFKIDGDHLRAAVEALVDQTEETALHPESCQANRHQHQYWGFRACITN